MPKDSVVINGFNGGLNVDSSTSDLISDGRGKDQLAQMNRVYTDQLGKVVAKHPQATSGASSGLTSSGVGTGGSDILIHDNTIYQENGLYKMGNDVVWSGATNYQAFTPTSGSLNPTTLSSFSSGTDISFEPNSAGVVLFKGKNSSILDGSTSMLFGEDDTLPNASYIRYSKDTNNNGRFEDSEDNNYWTDDNLALIGTAVDSNYPDNMIGKVLDGTEIDYFDWESSASTAISTFGLRFRVGRQAFLSSGGGTSGFYGVYGPNALNRDIVIEVKIPGIAQLEGLYIYYDTQFDNQGIHYGGASALDSHCKIYKLTDTELSSISPTIESNWTTITIPYSSSIHTGNNYSGDDRIRQIGIIPYFDSQNAALTSWFQIRHFELANPATSTWANRGFVFKQSLVSSGVESLLSTYSDNLLNLVNKEYTLTIPKPLSEGDSGKIYYQEITGDNNVELGVPFLLAEYDFTKGVKGVNSDSFVEWITDDGGSSYKRSIVFEDAPVASTYSLESGYPDGTSEVNALWKTATTIGRQVYIGNVKQPIDATDYDASLILKSAIGKPAGFSDKTYIDIEVGGDSITVLESSGDRLFVFTNNQLSIVNVAQDIEFLEAELPNYGIASKNQVCKVGEGIAFINETGVYYFNGQNFQELKGTAISTADFSGDKAILYDEVRKLLWCYADTNIVYYYSFKTNTWVGKDSNINVFPATNGVSYIDGKVHFTDSIAAGQSDIHKLDGSGTTSTSRDFSFTTGRIDCGDPSREKRFYSVYVFVLNSYSNLTFEYSLDGATTFSDPRIFDKTGLNQFKINDVANETSPQGKTGRDIVIRIKGEDASTEIDDITIVFRNKVLK